MMIKGKMFVGFSMMVRTSCSLQQDLKTPHDKHVARCQRIESTLLEHNCFGQGYTDNPRFDEPDNSDN